MANKYQVRVFGLKGEMKIINLCDTEEEMKNITVQQLKEKALKEFPYITGEECLRLIFTDKMLGDEARLCDYGIKHLSVIQMIVRVPGGGPGEMGDKSGKNRREEYLRLVFTDKVLDDVEARLCDYGIEHLSLIQMIVRVPGGGPGEMGDKSGKNRSMERLFSL